MAKSYLDKNGLTYFWGKITAYVASVMPTTAADVGAIPTTAKGAASGVCPLNSSSKIDSTYLPLYDGSVV